MRTIGKICVVAMGMSFGMQAVGQEGSDPSPGAKADDSWITISGTLVSPQPESFTLDYGDGIITVEVRGSDIYSHAYSVMEGGPVTVHGRLDASLFEEDSIEADSVYVENLNAYLYSSAAEETTDSPWYPASPASESDATIRGRVSGINPDEGQFTVDSGNRQITVDVGSLGYNPLDDRGFQKIESGDTVSVSGNLDSQFADSRVLLAEKVVSLWDPDDDSSRVAMPSVLN